MARLPVSIPGILIVTSLLTAPSAHAQVGQTEIGRLEVGEVELAYEIEGSGPPLVLIHGWAVHRRYWDGVAELLARDHTVIRYDRRGFGESSGRPDLTADPADLKTLLDSLGHSHAHIVGHSQGGHVALTFAVRYPGAVDGLVLFASAPPAGLTLPPGEGTPDVGEWASVGRAFGADSLRELIQSWAAKAFGDQGMSERARTLLEPYSGLDLIDPAPPSNLVAPASVDDLPAVKAPTLVIHGDSEMPWLRVVSGLLAFGIPGAERVVVAGGGHVVSWAEPERVAAEIRRFLSRIDEDGG